MKKSAAGRLCLAMAMAAGVSGCVTLENPEERQAEQQRQWNEMQNMQLEITKLRARLDGMQQSDEALARRMDELKSHVSTEMDSMRRSVSEVRASVSDSEGRLKQSWDESIGNVSKKIADMVNTSKPAPAPVQTGLEHTVGSGETLSEISKAYGVPVAAIVQANNLKDAHQIRVGQKLFIPAATAGGSSKR